MSSYALNKIGLKSTVFNLPEIGYSPSEKFDIGINRNYSEPNEKGEFEVFVTVHVKPSNLNSEILSVTYFGVFKHSNPEDEQLKFKDFAKNNAPAIIYPYIRQFVRTLTLEAGFNPIILPIVNFLKLKDDPAKK